jgi:hypothetical protein
VDFVGEITDDRLFLFGGVAKTDEAKGSKASFDVEGESKIADALFLRGGAKINGA